MSYVLLRGLGAPAPSCEWDMDCAPDSYCCSSPDGRRECMPSEACTKRVDEICASPEYKQTPHCVEWNDPKDPGWFEELEGPCDSDAECWPGLACCGQHPKGRFCAPRTMCGALSGKAQIPTWAIVGGGAVAVLAIVALAS